MSSTSFDIALDVSHHSEAHEHVQAEAVGRVDRGRIEVGDRVDQPGMPQLYLVPGPAGEQRDEFVARIRPLDRLSADRQRWRRACGARDRAARRSPCG